MAADPDATHPGTPPLIGWPLSRLGAFPRIGALALAIAAIAIAAFVGSRYYPGAGGESANELEKRIAEVDRDPTVASWDDTVVGDLLVERFYILDTATGERYVADFLKGRISGIENVQREDQPDSNVLLLDTKDMRRDRAFYTAYITSVSHPDASVDAFYLGVITPTGERDAFPLNYNGEIPNVHASFVIGDDHNPYDYMLRQTYKDITAPRPITLLSYNFVLSTSDVFPLFKNEYRLDRAMFISELLIVDATSKPNRSTYYKLLDKYPRSAGG
jgi:hypothetical protein